MKKVLSTILITVIAFIPTWIFIAARALISPEGFIQEFLVFGLGMWILGGLQLFLFFGSLYFLVMEVWTD